MGNCDVDILVPIVINPNRRNTTRPRRQTQVLLMSRYRPKSTVVKFYYRNPDCVQFSYRPPDRLVAQVTTAGTVVPVDEPFDRPACTEMRGGIPACSPVWHSLGISRVGVGSLPLVD